jgi:hypothetical protein
MLPTGTVDISEWSKAASDLFQFSKREFPDFVNGQALSVASRAGKLTIKADRNKIEHEMGVISKFEKLRGGNAGKKGWVRIGKRELVYDVSKSFAARIVNKRLRESGGSQLSGEELGKAALKLIAAKVRSVGFIKSGWIESIKTLSNIVYKKPRKATGIDGAKVYGKAKGWCKPAKQGDINPSCLIANTAILEAGRFSSKTGNPMAVAEAGLKKALNEAKQDMIAELGKRLEKKFKQVSAK